MKILNTRKLPKNTRGRLAENKPAEAKKRHAASEVTAPTGKGKRSARSTKKKKYRLNKKKLFRNILALVLLLAVFGSGFFFYLTRNFDKVDTSNADFAIDDQVADDLSGYRNIAILGL